MCVGYNRVVIPCFPSGLRIHPGDSPWLCIAKYSMEFSFFITSAVLLANNSHHSLTQVVI